ncbi:uncharacterized protein TNCV_682401 [Trichonephila clavipes]|nr:uncharacterized protein TNCV_682401 [Trichonephila clavipes]
MSSNLDSEDIGLNESNCEESEERADVIDSISVCPDIYVTKDASEWIPHDNNIPDKFATRNVLRQSNDPTSFAKHNVKVKTPLHPEKLTVWCALWAGGILLQKRSRPQRYSQW